MAEERRYGLHQHRLESNPLEQRFSDAWHETSGYDYDYWQYGEKILRDILSTDGYAVCVEDDMKQAIATVIQWLGSPVGQYFLSEVLEMEICR